MRCGDRQTALAANGLEEVQHRSDAGAVDVRTGAQVQDQAIVPVVEVSRDEVVEDSDIRISGYTGPIGLVAAD